MYGSALIVLLAVVAVVALLAIGPWGLPFVVLALVVGGVRLVALRRAEGEVPTVVPRRPEPTGEVRSAPTAEDTSNERTGQG